MKSKNINNMTFRYSVIYDMIYNTTSLNRDARLPIVLWGKFAMDVSDAIQLRADHSVVFVLRFGKIKVWKGIVHFSYSEYILCFFPLNSFHQFMMHNYVEDRSVSNAYNVSDVAINPSMNEVDAFMAL